jgi:hypothetical protein
MGEGGQAGPLHLLVEGGGLLALSLPLVQHLGQGLEGGEGQLQGHPGEGAKEKEKKKQKEKEKEMEMEMEMEMEKEKEKETEKKRRKKNHTQR